MSVVAAFLLPGSPLPYVQRDNPPWGALADAMDQAAVALANAEPETIIIYSTQWIAVLDQLWQTRPRACGLHVDENWHEYGELPFDLAIDTGLAETAIALTPEIGIRSKGVNYDQFPVDTGTIVAANFLDPDKSRRFVVTSNNVYHDWDMTIALGGTAARAAAKRQRRVAVVGVGGLSGSVYRKTINMGADKIASAADDEWNRRILSLMETGDVTALVDACPAFATEARADMGFKHFAFVLGALGGNFDGATVLGYGPLYGAGGAVVQLHA